MATKRTPLEQSVLQRWKGGPVHEWTTSPRLGNGRPKDASRVVVENAEQFCQRYGIPIKALCRYMRISDWAFRQARESVRPLPVIVEKLISKTIEEVKAGRIWLRRKSRQRWELERVTRSSWTLQPDRIEPPLAYRRNCPQNALYCAGAILPGDCPRRWKECGVFSTDWEEVEKIHRGYAEQET